MGIFDGITGAIGRTLNKNLVEALAAGGVHIASSDGSIDRDEVKAITNAMLNVDAISAAYADSLHLLTQPVEKFIALAQKSETQAYTQFRKECMDVRGDHEQALIVAAACWDVARKGGGVSAQEREAFLEVLGWLGVQSDELMLRGF